MSGIVRFLLGCGMAMVLACKPEAIPETPTTGNAGLDALNQRIAEDPENANLYFQRGNLYYELEAYDRAIEDLALAMRYDSNNVDYHHLLADIFLDNYKSQRALLTMERAAKLYPERIPTLLKLCEFQLILKQHEASMQTISNILLIDPGNTEALFMLGMNFRDQGNTQRAINSFQTAVEKDSDFIDAWIMLGNLYGDLGNENALQCFDNVIRLDSNNLSAWHSKAYFLQNNDRVNEALELYKKMHVLDAQYSDAYLNAGILYFTQDDLEKAQAEFEILSAVEPESAAAQYYLGLILEQNGDRAGAIQRLEQALALDANYRDAEDILRRLRPTR